MKLYMSINKPAINGYVCIDLATQPIDFNNLDSICEKSECIELVLDELLSYINLQQIPQILSQLVTRLRKNGKIVIINFDIADILKTYHNGLISIADLNFVLFGNDKIKRTSCMSHSDIQPILTNSGLVIDSVEISEGKFILKAHRS